MARARYNIPFRRRLPGLALMLVGVVLSLLGASLLAFPFILAAAIYFIWVFRTSEKVSG
jgi:Flp pilus assembly protein TadB